MSLLSIPYTYNHFLISAISFSISIHFLLFLMPIQEEGIPAISPKIILVSFPTIVQSENDLPSLSGFQCHFRAIRKVQNIGRKHRKFVWHFNFSFLKIFKNYERNWQTWLQSEQINNIE